MRTAPSGQTVRQDGGGRANRFLFPLPNEKMYSPIEEVYLENLDITWKQQSLHRPDVFDEQPSVRDVYEHEIPQVYIRYGKYVQMEGRLRVDASLTDVIQKQEILEHTECCEIKNLCTGHGNV